MHAIRRSDTVGRTFLYIVLLRNKPGIADIRYVTTSKEAKQYKKEYGELADYICIDTKDGAGYSYKLREWHFSTSDIVMSSVDHLAEDKQSILDVRRGLIAEMSLKKVESYALLMPYY